MRADRQILDGPFILNELVQWSKKKKKQTMVFKVDFEKAYDSVRWDFVDDILKKFGFGEKWCRWIQSCLRSLRGSVIVNGSPTKEFQFYKDDAIFMGQWSESNIDIIVFVLDCFYRALGLRINVAKSKLMGIFVDAVKVEQAAAKIRCVTLKTPFIYLGACVGGLMSRKNALASKDKGGLGVSSLFALNRGLLFKWVWHFISQSSSLWARVIKALHEEDGKIGKNVKSTYPSLWLNIIHEVEMLKLRAWRRETTFKILYPKMYALELIKSIDVASKMSHSGLEYSFRSNSRGEVEQVRFNRLKEKVEGCLLINMNDRWIWSLEGLGVFLVTSVRKLIDDVLLPEVITKTRWIKAVPIKINVYAWKVKLDCLPTRLNISRRGMDIESILCPMCGKAVKSFRHLFFICRLTSEIICKISRWWDIGYTKITSYEEWLDWITNLQMSLKHNRIFE
nr:hypothetical protein [Tanacetum cinerariifolium]